MNVLVVGSTGGSGRAAVHHLLRLGHSVTAMSRRPDAPSETAPRLRLVRGDATNDADVALAVAGQDAVVVTVGITENPLRVRIFGPSRTRADVRSRGTAVLASAMRRYGVRRLVVQSSYGVGDSRDRLRLVDRLLFALLLAPQIADTEVQEAVVKESGLDWTLVQPVHLTDASDSPAAFISTNGETARMNVSRDAIGRFLAEAAGSDTFVGKTVAVSGALQSAHRRISDHGEHAITAEWPIRR